MSDDDHDDSAMLALIPSNSRALAVPGGIPADKVHCTLVFLGDGVSTWSDQRKEALMRAAENLANMTSPLIADVFSHSTWNADRAPNPQGKSTEPTIVYQLRDDGRLGHLHRRALERLAPVLGADFPDQWSPYLPHIAGAYGETDAGKLRTGTGPVTFTRLRLALGTDVHEFPLTSNGALAQEGIDTMSKDTKAKPKVGRTGDTEVKVDPETGQLQLHWPCLVIEGMETGDGRFIPYGSLGHRGLPLTVSGQTKTAKGHDGAEAFGKITRLERHEGPTKISKETGEPFPEGTAVWEAWGEADPESEPGKLVSKGYLRGNSADLAEVDAEEELADDGQSTVVHMHGGKIAGTTLVPIPAFADGFVEIDGEVAETTPAMEPLVADAEPSPAWRIVDDPVELTAAGEPEEEPFRPPLRLFQPRQLSGITPLTLEPQGDGTIAVFGHVADFSQSHIGFNGRPVFARRSPSGYTKGFNTGALRVLDEDGAERTAAVGRLTVGGGHAPTPGGSAALTAAQAKAFYDDAATAWAWVTASDDAHGVQVNGVVIPGTSDAKVTQALAHPVSGDWRPMDGRLELVAAHCVNVAGIPVPRALVASGELTALVAAGAVAPAADNPEVMAARVADVVREAVRHELADLHDLLAKLAPPDSLLIDQRDAVLADMEFDDLLAEFGVARDSFDPESLSDEEVSSLVAQFGQDLEPITFAFDGQEWMIGEALDGEVLANWVAKAGGLHPFIKRIKNHLQQKGDTASKAIATAFNVVKKMCATGDTNWPGKQQVNAGSQAQACAAAKWIEAHTGD